jgi:hypothetical protein
MSVFCKEERAEIQGAFHFVFELSDREGEYVFKHQ